jgi:peptide/nickel transport system permease protein
VRKKQRTNEILYDNGAGERESYWSLVWRKYRRSGIAMLGSVIVTVLILLALFPEFFSTEDPVKLNMRHTYYPPQLIRLVDLDGKLRFPLVAYGVKQTLDPRTMIPKWGVDKGQPFKVRLFVHGYRYKILGLVPCDLHLFGANGDGYVYILGADKFGRDLWGRICMGSRITLSMAIFGTIISILLGSTLGIMSGYYGGWADNLLQRFIEFVQSFPQLPLWMALAAVIPREWDQLSVFVMMSLIFALMSWTLLAREVRGKVLAMRETEFVLAAKEMGASDARIIFKHLFPNNLSQIIVELTLTVPSIVLAESFLSFLGIGIQEPLVSWGTLMRDSQTIQTLGFHLWITSPVIFILLAVLGFNFVGDGLRDAADPYSRH